MKIWTKLKWLAGLLTIFLLILATNLIDKDNFSRIEQSVETIYKEVLFAKDKLMQLSELVHEKEMAYALNDTTHHRLIAPTSNKRILTLLHDCEDVMQKGQEKKVFAELRKDLQRLLKMEDPQMPKDSTHRLNALQQLASIRTNIYELAEVQIEEGRLQKFNSLAAMNSTKLYTRIEVYILAFFATIMLFLVLYSPKRKNTA